MTGEENTILISENTTPKVDSTIAKDITDISEEQLSKEMSEQYKVAMEILAKNKEDQLAKFVTNPSAIALESPLAETGAGMNRVKKTAKQLFTLYLTNPLVARAINIKADTLVSKGYNIKGEDKNGVDACTELINNSGGINLFWQSAVNTEIAGNGFLEKIYNDKYTKILKLKHVHPITLDFKKDLSYSKIVVDEDTGEPVGFTQFYYDANGAYMEKDVDKEKICHLKFNCLGDEFEGLSSIQPGYDTIVRLMNMEYSAAEAAIKTANPLIVGKCNTKSPAQIAMWGSILGRINGREQIFLPQDMELDFKSPGTQNFSDYADYFINIVVSTFGVPKAVLLGGGDSGSGNRAEGVVLSRHFYSVIKRNQIYMAEFFNKIFEEYAELAGFTAPKLEFEDIAEDATLMADSAIKLFTAGIITNKEARSMIGLEEMVEGEMKNTKPSLDAELKKSDMQVAFPESKGSQVGVKNSQKADPFSEVSPASK